MANPLSPSSFVPMDRRTFFTLFASGYPGPGDWELYRLAGKPRLMVMLNMVRGQDPGSRAFIAQLKQEWGPDRPRVIVRVDEPDDRLISAQELRLQLLQVLGMGLTVDAVILGKNEPDTGFPWHYYRTPELDGPRELFNWGEAYIAAHARRVGLQARAIRGVGIGGVKVNDPLPFPVVTPGWACRDLWEDGELQPGFYAWRDYARDYGYWEAQGFSLHSYSAFWDDKEEPIRHKKRLQTYLSAFHYGPAYYGEFGVLLETDPFRVRCYLRYCESIRVSKVYGPRVKMFSPFVWVGDGIGWDPRYIMEGRESFVMIGDYITRGVVPA